MFRAVSTFALVAVVLFAVVCVAFAGVDDDSSSNDVEGNKVDDISHGLGNHIAWHPLKEGLELAKQEGKPLMLIIHKSWCGACKSLKPKLKASKEMEKLSENFIMVNTEDSDEPDEEIYRPDGGYIPRILFFNPAGELLKEIINENGNPQYKYYYFDADSVIESMKKLVKSDKNSKSDQENADLPEKVNITREEKVEL